MKVTKQTFATFTRKKVPLANTIHHSSFIYNQFKKLNLYKFYSNRVINHLMSILISIFISGYHGKTTDFAKNSSCHRTTIAHFLNSGKWNDSLLSDALKQAVIEIIYSEAARTGNPVFCIVDDTIASKTKPLSRALHPIEDAYFHQSHLKKKQDYRHQAVAVMLSCNGIVLNYAFVMYNKSISKIDIVQNITKELPVPPVMSYFLCDCWYVSEKIINTFAQKGFHTIGALKTNRLLYPSGMKKKFSELAAELSVTHKEKVGSGKHFHNVLCLSEAKGMDIKMIKNAGGVITHPYGSVVRSLLVGILELCVEEIMVIGHTDCGVQGMDPKVLLKGLEKRGVEKKHMDIIRNSGIDLERWLAGFDSVEQSVEDTVFALQNHPLMPQDIKIYGFIMDSITGELKRI